MNSYTAANEFPYKIFRDLELLKSILQDKKILPRHIQLSPTNKCTLNCSFCSCKKRDKFKEWSLEDVKNIVKILKKIKTIGVTITGGGEPLLFQYINQLILLLKIANIKIGLVSNGTVDLMESLIPFITWCRFSFSGERKDKDKFLNHVSKWLNKGVDLAFSFVVTRQTTNITNIVDLVEFANTNKFTHVRLVSDILDVENVHNNFTLIQNHLKEFVDDKLVIYQSRNTFTKGIPKCSISLLKPMIYSDGNIYPCCGTQYAITDNLGDMPIQMSMGHYKNLPTVIKNQSCFNGSVCNICYYESYNTTLNELLSELHHLEFI